MSKKCTKEKDNINPYITDLHCPLNLQILNCLIGLIIPLMHVNIILPRLSDAYNAPDILLKLAINAHTEAL